MKNQSLLEPRTQKILKHKISPQIKTNIHNLEPEDIKFISIATSQALEIPPDIWSRQTGTVLIGYFPGTDCHAPLGTESLVDLWTTIPINTKTCHVSLGTESLVDLTVTAPRLSHGGAPPL